MAYLLVGCQASEKVQLKFTEIEKIAKQSLERKRSKRLIKFKLSFLRRMLQEDQLYEHILHNNKILAQ